MNLREKMAHILMELKASGAEPKEGLTNLME